MFPSQLGGAFGLSAMIRRHALPLLTLLVMLLGATGEALAHAVAEGDKGYIQEIYGVHLISFIYLGAKHMVTGYDHILFLLGVIFFLYRMQHIAIYVSLFAIGHSTTMLLGVYFNIGINSYLIDASSDSPLSTRRSITSGRISAGSAFSPIPRWRRWSSACSMALDCRARSLSTISLLMDWSPISWRSTLG